MDLLDPKEVCCGPTEKVHPRGALATQDVPKSSSPARDTQGERIDKLEIQMNRLAQDVEMIKNQQCETAVAIQRALQRGVCSLGGRFRLVNGICVSSNGGQTKIEKSSRSSCCSVSSASPENKESKERSKSVKGDDDECGGFVLG